jgi:heat shock protein HslJ
MTGGYTIDDDTLRIGPLAQTAMACDDALMAHDPWLAGFLEGRPTAPLRQDVLTLEHDGTTIDLGDQDLIAYE